MKTDKQMRDEKIKKAKKMNSERMKKADNKSDILK